MPMTVSTMHIHSGLCSYTLPCELSCPWDMGSSCILLKEDSKGELVKKTVASHEELQAKPQKESRSITVRMMALMV